MNDERLEKQLNFILEIDQEKNIFRKTHLTNHGRAENDAEHAWHMAVMAYLLREYSQQPVDIAKVMLMCLIHDVVEIDAGDTYAYDEEAKKSQHEREQAAADRLFSILPKEQGEEMRSLFEEFEANETAEAHFARAMDNIQPFLLNHSNGGGDWKKNQVSISQVLKRQSITALGSQKLYDYVYEKLQEHVEAGDLKEDRLTNVQTAE